MSKTLSSILTPVTTTGTGSVVLAVSPTLITPNIGVPVSGNLVNCIFPTTIAQPAYNTANSGIALAQTAFSQANSAYTVANTKFSANGGTITGSVTITTDLSVSGNIYFSGNVTTISSNNLSINDPLIYLAQDNPANLQDIGLVGHYTTDHYQHTGFVRDASDGIWKLFSNVIPEPTSTVDFSGNIIYDTVRVGSLVTSNAIFNVANGTSPFLVASPTLVANLNADLFDGQHGSYYTELSNSAFSQANSGITLANSAYNQANSGITLANSGILVSQAAFAQANAALTLANSAYTSANTNTVVLTKNYNFVGVLSNNTGTIRWYPYKSVIVQSAYITIGTTTTSDISVSILKNGTLTTTLVLSASQYKTNITTGLNIALSSNDYITVNVSANGGSDLTLTLLYT